MNFAYAIGHFDPRLSQPQPPGYPVFVLEMHLLRLLQVKNPENNLRILSLAGSGAALWLIATLGGALFGGRAGIWASVLLAFYPSFWFAGLTSPVRVQLAVVSIAVAASSLRMMQGHARWIFLSAIILGMGSGIRPELGPLLLPLWGWCLAGGEYGRPARVSALLTLAASVMVWLVPTALAAGGLASYVRNCWIYLVDQVTLAPTVLGRDDEFLATLSRFLVWGASVLPGLVLPAILAWRSNERLGFARFQSLFLLIWFLPLALFALAVHMADPGHAAAMAPIFCVAGGFFVDRALTLWRDKASRFELAAAVGFTCALFLLYFLGSHGMQFFGIPVLSAVTALVLMRGRGPMPGWRPEWQGAILLLLPSLLLHLAIFLQSGWHYRAQAGSAGLGGLAERFWSRVNTEVHALSFNLVRQVTNADDAVLRDAMKWVAGNPARTSIVWVDGVTDWRKVSYYLPQTKVFAITRRMTPSPSPSMVIARGPEIEEVRNFAAPFVLRPQAGGALIWILNQRGDWKEELLRAGALCEGAVCKQDLDGQGGMLRIRDILLLWESDTARKNRRL